MESFKLSDNQKFSPESENIATERARAATQKRYQSELKRIQTLTSDTMPKAKRSAAMSLLHNAAWMKIKLDEARADMMCQAIVTDYNNGGGQQGTRENPAFSAYNKLFASYSRCVKQITDLMVGDAGEQRDELAGFLNETRL
ncbi:MAG: hypothetical protein RR842_09880 [Gordonibacter sp.]|uniref:hypothetical protein n=1 Tax=Gordonibacter sp. TaxID=1968902 RepID=UPI002FC82AC7